MMKSENLFVKICKYNSLKHKHYPFNKSCKMACYLERNFASIFLLHFSGFFSMSCSQSLRTDHPSRLSLRLYLLSRLMLLSILSRQYFFLGFFFSPYLYPCQKSPSQKIATLFLLCAKSGLPYISGCISNL